MSHREVVPLLGMIDGRWCCCEGEAGKKKVAPLCCCCDQPFASPDRLDQNEFDEFLKQAGFSSDVDLKFDYRKYIHNIMVGKPLTSMVAP